MLLVKPFNKSFWIHNSRTKRKDTRLQLWCFVYLVARFLGVMIGVYKYDLLFHAI